MVGWATSNPSAHSQRKKKNKKFKGKKKAYIAWEDNASTTSESSSESKEEEVNLCLRANKDQSNPSSKYMCLMANGELETSSQVSNSENYDELLDAFQELFQSFETLSSKHSSLKKNFKTLENKLQHVEEEKEILKSNLENLETISKERNCENCEILKKKISDHEEVISKFSKSSLRLETILNSQKESSNKTGLGFIQGNGIEKQKTVFVKESKQSSQKPFVNSFKHKTGLGFDPKKSLEKQKTVFTKTSSQQNFQKFPLKHFHKPKYSSPKCFYCMKHGHTVNKCLIKHEGVPSGKFIWVRVND